MIPSRLCGGEPSLNVLRDVIVVTFRSPIRFKTFICLLDIIYRVQDSHAEKIFLIKGVIRVPL